MPHAEKRLPAPGAVRFGIADIAQGMIRDEPCSHDIMAAPSEARDGRRMSAFMMSVRAHDDQTERLQAAQPENQPPPCSQGSASPRYLLFSAAFASGIHLAASDRMNALKSSVFMPLGTAVCFE